MNLVLKTIALIYLVFNTLFRMGNLIYLYSIRDFDLPTVIIVLTSIMVVLGVWFIVKRLRNRLLLRHVLAYSIVVVLVMTFNLLYIAVTFPLPLTLSESFVVGSVLDIIVNLIILRYGYKQVRRQYIEVDQNAFNKKENGRND